MAIEIDLSGKVAVVTGAGRGIGKAISIALAEAGADVVVAARTVSQLEETAKEIRFRGRNSMPIATDVTQKMQVEERVFVNVKELIQPYITRLQNSRLNHQQSTSLNILESHLKNIISPFISNLNAKYMGFTPKEIQVASLIREGKTTKEIAEVLHSSQRAVEFHRNSLRDKLGIKNKKANLRSYLLSLT